MSRYEASEPRSRGFSPWSVLLFVLRLGGLMPFSSWLLVALAAMAWHVFEQNVAYPQMSWMGEPRPLDARNPATWTRTLRNDGFTIGYSDLRGNPLWVSYALTPPADAPYPDSPARYSADWRSFNRVSPENYAGSGYDLGQMAPARLLGLIHGREAQMDAFLMTNVAPRKAALNDKLWERLKWVELEYFAKRFGKIWMLAGPIFDPPSERLRSTWRVEIPDGFYEIIVADEPRAILALTIPQTVAGDEPLDHFLTSVDSIEKRVGLDFFQQLDDAQENRLEAAIDPEPWRLHELSRLPPKSRHRSALADTLRKGGDKP